jgi:hypothetical protein
MHSEARRQVRTCRYPPSWPRPFYLPPGTKKTSSFAASSSQPVRFAHLVVSNTLSSRPRHLRVFGRTVWPFFALDLPSSGSLVISPKPLADWKARVTIWLLASYITGFQCRKIVKPLRASRHSSKICPPRICHFGAGLSLPLHA